jgi:hypothetical protein
MEKISWTDCVRNEEVLQRVAFCGERALEEAMDLLEDKRMNNSNFRKGIYGRYT